MGEEVSSMLSAERPILFVDLDGSLTATDTLWESVFKLLRHSFWFVFVLPVWLKSGRAYLKQQIARRIEFDPAAIPYNESVTAYIRGEKTAGRRIILATASDRSIANRVADHLQLFDHVIASDGEDNLKGNRKLKAMQQIVDENGFDYIGDSTADLPIWRSAGRAMVVNPSKSLIQAIEKDSVVAKTFIDQENVISNIFKALRIHQWVKNLLLFVPLVLAHQIDGITLSKALIAFICFGLVASSGYILNDLLDLEADRRHPRKRNRPFASGQLPIQHGLVLASTNVILALFLSVLVLPLLFAEMLLGYLILTMTYSLYLKKKLMVDVLLLGGFYAYRVVAGAVAIGVVISPWLIAFSIFFFLSLAFVKRYTELQGTELPGKVAGRGYYTDDLAMIRVVGPSAGYISVLVLALYINSGEVRDLYSQPNWLWLICPCLLYWISRIWFLAHRGQIEDDPVMGAIKDKNSYLVGIVVLLLIIFASI